jgi:hypothetical protein
MVTDDERPVPLARRLAVGALLAIAGAATGAAVARFTFLGDTNLPDTVAGLVAISLLAMAVISVFIMARRPASVPKGCGVLQIIVTGLAGVMLLAPITPLGLAPDVTFFGIAALLAIQTVANLMLWRRADELLRRITVEAGALTFWLSQGVLFLYAAAERLGLVPEVNAWSLIGVMMALYILASGIVAARRGLS